MKGDKIVTKVQPLLDLNEEIELTPPGYTHVGNATAASDGWDAIQQYRAEMSWLSNVMFAIPCRLQGQLFFAVYHKVS